MKRELYKKYLTEAYGAYVKINTMATNDNKRLLKDIYVPLTLVKEPKVNSNKRIKMDGFPDELNRQSEKTLIVDRAGMGKSTLMKRIFIDVFEKQERIPLYVELRRVSGGETIKEHIIKMLQLDSEGSEIFLFDLNEGHFVVILDGFDEVQSEHRNQMITDILNFSTQYNQNTFILTSRPEDDFQALVDFQKYTIAPLMQRESYDLLRKHDTSENLSDHLIKKLELRENASIKEYLKTPLLVSLLYAAFNFKHTIPLKKHLFYEQVFDAFFQKHDLTKEGGYTREKKSKLDVYDFERVLRLLGLKCMTTQQVEFKIRELIDIVDGSKPFFPDLNFLSADFVDDLHCSVPLFCNDGPFLKWVHKSMQEYFAAMFIYVDSKTEQDAMLQAILNSEKLNTYYNMLDIYYDVDNYGFQKNITLPLLQGYIDFYEQNYHEINGINSQFVEERIGLLYLRKAAVGFNKTIDQSKDMFNEMSVWCATHGFRLNNMHSFPLGRYHCCIANRIDPKFRLLEIIRSKKEDLFATVSNLFYDNVPMGLNNKDYQVISGIMDYSESEELYTCCNYFLRHTTMLEDNYLKYEKAKEEVELITKNIEAKEKASLLSSLL